jgi:hypothetical protein
VGFPAAHRRVVIDDQHHAASVMAPGVTIGIAPILDNDLSDAAPIRTQVYFNPILEAIGTHPACNRAPMVRVIPRIPSEQHAHGVFTKKIPSHHDSGWRGS